MCFLQVFQQAICMAGHAAAIAGKAQMFFRSRFHINLSYFHVQNPCNIFPHSRNMILQLRPLGDHGNINIPNFITRFSHLFTHDPQ